MTNCKPSSPLLSNVLLQPIDLWLDDPDADEIMLNREGVIFVERHNQFFRYQVPELDIKGLNRLFRLIANENKQELNERKPILSGKLKEEMRVQLVIPPVAPTYCFSIRKKKVNNYNIDDLRRKGFINAANPFYQSTTINNQVNETLYTLYKKKTWPTFIKKALEFRKNIIISGATSSGKTTFLNACLNELPPSERLIILEDTLEVQVAHENVVRLLAHKDQQGLSKITMQDLVQCSLRLRPDRIIMGEVRGREILDFITATLTGHNGAMTTIHAENPEIAFARMCQMYKLNGHSMMADKDIYGELRQAIDIIFQLNRTPQGRQLASVYFKYANEKEGKPYL